MIPPIAESGDPRSNVRLLEALDAILGSMGDGVLAFDREYRYFFWSNTMERITGLAAPEVLGRVAFEAFPFLGAIGQDACLRDALAGRQTVTRRRQYDVPETGRRGFYDGYYSPLVEGGVVVGGAAVIRDVTAATVAEQQVQEMELRFSNMADSSPVMLWMSSTDALCNFFNQTWLDFTGRTPKEEWGVGWAEGIHPEDFQRCMDTYLTAFNDRREFEMEYRLRRKDGVYRWLLDCGVPRFGPEGTFAGYIGSCVDITDSKERETSLREALRQRDEFLTLTSHELRTPLTTLQLQLQWLERATAVAGAPCFAENVRLAARQTARLVSLVEHLLDVSRLSAGLLTLERVEMDLAALTAEVVGQMRPALEATGSTVVLSATPIVGRWDLLRLGLVITNLLANASKFGAGRPIEIDVRTGVDRAILSVRDHGIGIRHEDQKRIFERFARAVPSSHYGGFGLGLWISREIVCAHGGSITVESRPGKGSTFTVTLPREERNA